jgi:Protein of unknown function (DUF3047)
MRGRAADRQPTQEECATGAIIPDSGRSGRIGSGGLHLPRGSGRHHRWVGIGLGIGVAIGVGTGAGLALCAAADPAPPALAPLVDPQGRTPAAWQVHGLPHQRKPFTQFSVQQVDGMPALRIESQAGYGNLVHALLNCAAPAMASAAPEPASAPPGPATCGPAAGPHGAQHLAWTWRVDTPNPQADLQVRALEDTALRVCALFDLPLGRVPLSERPMLLLARAASEHPVPAAAVCYVWDSRLAPGTVVESPYTRRVRSIVLRGPEAPLQQWQEQDRDIAADFSTLFGAESEQVPPLAGVLVGADADNTQAHSVAHVAQMRLK